MSSIYAVVDKTKKKNCSLPKKEMESDEAGSGLPLYAVVDKKKKPDVAAPCINCPDDSSKRKYCTTNIC